MLKTLSRIPLFISMIRYGNAHNRDFGREHAAFFDDMLTDLQGLGVPSLEGLKVLDVGCGKAYWLSLLTAAKGAEATGIDPEAVRAEISFGKYWRILRANGLERFARTLLWDVAYRSPYYDALSKASGLALDHRKVALERAGVSPLPFEDNSFDLVVSHEVFEHLPDMDSAAREVRRVLKPDGLTYIFVHSFTSISGGHHIAWKYPDKEPSDTVPAWDHLRDNTHPNIPSWVNGFREPIYREAFEREFDILDWKYSHREGELLLTSQVREELSEYSEHELLTKGFTIIARPKA